MKEIDLNKLKLKTFSEQDALDYCQINNINPDKITELNLSKNQLTDISIIQYLNKLEVLYISGNQITNISVLKYLKNLKSLYIQKLRLESDQVQYINNLKNLKTLFCYNRFKDMSVINKLNNIKIII